MNYTGSYGKYPEVVFIPLKRHPGNNNPVIIWKVKDVKSKKVVAYIIEKQVV